MIDTSILDGIITGRVDPYIYAFTTETVPNYLKVGDTYRPVETRLNEWRKHFSNLVPQYKQKAKVKDGRIFRDYSVHQYLEKDLGCTRLPKGLYILDYYSKEFFRGATKDNIEEAINDIKEDAASNGGKYTLYSADRLPESYHYERTQTFPLRPNQEETVNNFIHAYKEKNRTNLLMYAVMRFGKSFTAMCCSQALDECKITLIVSAKADVRNEWQKTVESHIRFADYVFIDKESLSKDDAIISKSIANGKRVAIFLTLQDLQGTEIKARHKELFKSQIDLLIVDETHFGARAAQLGKILESAGMMTKSEISNELKDIDSEEDSEVNDQLVKQLNARIKLHLSGTPYRILMGDEFTKDDIIAFCQFTDIVELQQQWEEMRLEMDEMDSDGNEQQEWDNPYFGFPQMVRFAFRPSDTARRKMEQLREQGYSNAFSALFKPKSITKKSDGSHKLFVHEKEVLDLLQIVDGTKQDENILGFLDYPKIQEGKMCHHMVFVLPYRASCDAMEQLILSNTGGFRNLSKYEIINISGVDNNSLGQSNDQIKSRIRKCEEDGKMTITLTVNRMLTGSTVEQWDTMLYFKDTSSPQEYDQAIFRLQNQFIKTYTESDGKTIKYNMKPQTLLVDFDPDRMFRMQELKSQFYNANTDERGNDKLEERIEKELRISPIITLNHNKLAQVTPANIMDAVRNYSQSKSIADESQDIPFDLSLLDIELFRKEIEDLKAIDSTKGIEIRPITDDEVDDMDVPDTQEPHATSGLTPNNTRNLGTSDNQESVESIEKKFSTYYSKILFFSFLTDNKVRSLQDIINQISKNENDHRIARNIGLKLSILVLLQNKCNAFILSKLDYKIQSLNELMSDCSLNPIHRAEVAMTKFARLSNSEVVTPTLLADELIALVPREEVSDSTVFLDIAAVQGEMVCAIYKRYGSLVKDNIYSVPTSALTYELTRKVYRLLGLQENNVFTFYSTDLIKPDADDKLTVLSKLNPTIVCGVPPFSERVAGGRGDGGSAIYHKFFNSAKDTIAPRYISMMTQSTWYTGGRGEGLDNFRNYMLSINTTDRHIREMHDYPNIEAYIKGVTTLRGGVCLFLWDASYDGDCYFINRINHHDYPMLRPLRYERGNYHANFLIRWNKGLSILDKVLANGDPNITENGLMRRRNPFGFVSDDIDKKLIGKAKSTSRKTKVYLNKGNIGYALGKDFTKEKNGLLKQWKVLVAKSSSGGDELPHLVISNPIVSEPGSATAHTHYVIEGVKSKAEAVNLAEYMKTKFFRFMVNLLRSNQNMRVDMYQFAPRLDFSRQWTDAQLFERYHLDEEDVEFINMIIKERH